MPQSSRKPVAIKRQIRIDGDTAFVPLTQGYEAIVDAADVPAVERRNWLASVVRRRDGSIRTVYAATREPRGPYRQTTIYMHRLLTGTAAGLETDHRDGDGLNNRRTNLRVATKAQNMHNQRLPENNTSGVKGVSRDKWSGKWHARIGLNGKRKSLGYFEDLDAAAAAYARASSELHSSFGRVA